MKCFIHEYFVYIMTNKPNGVLYIGVTNNLIRRVFEHRNSIVKGFTQKYKLTHLVYFETHQFITLAIQREKNIKHWKREWKIELIEKLNPNWKDLWETICQ